jgi:hypothetical protein
MHLDAYIRTSEVKRFKPRIMEVNTYELTPDPRELSSGRDDYEIYLQMVIGNGQIGGTKVTCSGKTLAKGRLDSPTYLGMASEFSNNKIRVETNVLDMNPATNMCVITTRFQDELNNVLFDRIDKGEAPENGGASFIGKYAVSLLLLLCISLASVTKLKAQTFSNELSFDQLATPTSPGFMLLDQAPSAIERPTTP